MKLKINKINRNLLVSIIISLLVLIVGTYAWLTWRSNETALKLTVGETGRIMITLSPYQFNSSIIPSTTYEENDYVNVKAENESTGNTYSIDLYYKITNIPDELISSDFKYMILRSTDNGNTYTEYKDGDFSSASSNSEYTILSNEKISSNTEYLYKVYLWIDGSVNDNTAMEGKVFEAELRANFQLKIPDLEYNITTINNTSSNNLGNTGFYNLSSYNCNNGTNLTYDTYSRKITANGIDKCSLNFTQVDNPLLYDVVEIGDYIEYTGNNGCSGNQCSGWNASQTATDIYDNYGYCYSSSYKYYVYGWRVIHKTDNSVYIVSAGSPECVAGTSSDSEATKTSLNSASLKYCNTSYLSGGVCDNTTAHALNGDDFYKFTSQYYGSENARYLYSYNDGGAYGSSYCYGKYSNTYCGYNNDVIDNGGYYWFGSGYSSTRTLGWYPYDRNVGSDSGPYAYGVRPVLKLDSTIQATGGSGTIGNPYKISTRS